MTKTQRKRLQSTRNAVKSMTRDELVQESRKYPSLAAMASSKKMKMEVLESLAKKNHIQFQFNSSKKRTTKNMASGALIRSWTRGTLLRHIREAGGVPQLAKKLDVAPSVIWRVRNELRSKADVKNSSNSSGISRERVIAALYDRNISTEEIGTFLKEFGLSK